LTCPRNAIGAPYARQGIMTLAVELVLRFAFNELGLHRVEAACLPSNTPSRKLLTKCGFRQEGYAPQYLKINGAWEDHVLFALLSSEVRPATVQACPASTDKVDRSTPSLANALSHLVSRS
jgi:RimJ/RimL family protein N-acetyltransferase